MSDLSLSVILVVREGAHPEALLDALGRALLPGDEAVLIDDAAPEAVATTLAGFAPEGVRARPVRLASRSPGGIGIAANLGLAEARGDAVMVCDDTAVIEPGALVSARAVLARGADMVLAPGGRAEGAASPEGGGFRFDDPDPSGDPGLAALWAHLLALDEAAQEDRRAGALMLPARTPRLMRRDWCERAGLRFPDGGLPRSEIGFHHDSVTRAGKIGLSPDALARDLPAAPPTGETAVAGALALAGHWRAMAPAGGVAPDWALRVMARDLPQVPDGWLHDHAAAMAAAFAGEAAQAPPGGVPSEADRLRARLALGPEALGRLWLAERAAARLAALEAQVAALRGEFAALRDHALLAADEARARAATAEFEALRALGEREEG